MRERCRDRPEYAVFFARRTLVELAGAIAKGIALRVGVIGNSSHPFWEAVCILSQFGVSKCVLSIVQLGLETGTRPVPDSENVPRWVEKTGPWSFTADGGC